MVVGISSGAGLEGRESMGGYAAGKAAMDGELLSLSFFLLRPTLTLMDPPRKIDETDMGLVSCDLGMMKVLAKEVAEFNVRALTVSLGGFNTNMPNVVQIGGNPLPDDYKGTVVDQMMQTMGSGNFVPDGDKDKAMKAVYEVVMGVGVGVGREGERFLPLGRDIAVRVQQVEDSLAHSMKVFGELCNNVYAER